MKTQYKVPFELRSFITENVGITMFNITVADVDFSSVGESKRNPIDEADEELGLLLSSARAFQTMANLIFKEANIRENDNAREAKRKRLAKLTPEQIAAKQAITDSYRAKLKRELPVNIKAPAATTRKTVTKKKTSNV